MRKFHLGDILSITTGYLMSLAGMSGVYAILNYLTGEELFTHQLPRAANACKGPLLAQHPQLVGADCSGVTTENHAARLAELVATYGEWLMVAPVGGGEYQPKNPLIELAEMTDAKPVIVVTE